MKNKMIRGLAFGISIFIVMLIVMNIGLSGNTYKIVMVVSLVITGVVVDQVLSRLR